MYKSGSRAEVCNYSPISVLSNFPKVFEICIYSHWFQYFLPQIFPDQPGFLPGGSTVPNLLHMTQDISGTSPVALQVDVIHTDFSKAFERININILMQKLKQICVPGRLCCLLYSYLTDKQHLTN